MRDDSLITIDSSRDPRFPARPEALSEIRRFVAAWLRRAGASDEEVGDVVLACDEACTNAVEHADGGRELVVGRRVLPDGVIRLTVRDFGRWSVPKAASDPSAHARGRGIALMRQLVDNVTIRRYRNGTEVVLYRRLENAGRLHAGHRVAGRALH